MKILIAEDDTFFRKLLQQLLSSEYEVLLQEDGNAAWQFLQESSEPMLAILDWVMPGLSGPEICRLARRNPATTGSYLLLVTSRNSPEDVVAGLRAGADDYVTKPFEPEELRARVRLGHRIIKSEKLRRLQISALENSWMRERALQEKLASLESQMRAENSTDALYAHPLPQIGNKIEPEITSTALLVNKGKVL